MPAKPTILIIITVENIQKPYFNPKVFSTPFTEQFAWNIEMLNYRLNRIWMIDTSIKENQQEYLMAFDATIILFRCLFLENRQDNYTFQNYYRLTGREEIAKAIDDYLDTPFQPFADVSIRKTLKFIADKFVCHTDKVKNVDIGMANAIMSNLRNPYFENNFKTIVSNLNRIIESAPAL